MASLSPFPQHSCGKKQTQEAGSDPAELKPQQSSAREKGRAREGTENSEMWWDWEGEMWGRGVNLNRGFGTGPFSHTPSFPSRPVTPAPFLGPATSS